MGLGARGRNCAIIWIQGCVCNARCCRAYPDACNLQATDATWKASAVQTAGRQQSWRSGSWVGPEWVGREEGRRSGQRHLCFRCPSAGLPRGRADGGIANSELYRIYSAHTLPRRKASIVAAACILSFTNLSPIPSRSGSCNLPGFRTQRTSASTNSCSLRRGNGNRRVTRFPGRPG